MVRVKAGPLSVSSRGRVGVRAGPVGIYGGGGRGSGGGAILGIVVFALIVVLIATYWYVVLAIVGVATLIGVLVALGRSSDRRRLERQEQAAREEAAAQFERGRPEREAREQQQLAEIQRNRAALEAKAERAREQWLHDPPPDLELPGRFTDRWFEENGPALHPGQIPILIDELYERGWTDERIERRVEPYLEQNPYFDLAVKQMDEEEAAEDADDASEAVAD